MAIMKTRHAHGYLATPEEIDAVVEIAQRSKIDEAWFGEVLEARARDGKKVHVVRDHERGTILSFKYAVRLLYEGIRSPFDYVSKSQGAVFENLLKKLGISSAGAGKTDSLTSRIADKSREQFRELWCVTFVEYGDSVDGKARVLGLYRSKDEAHRGMEEDAENYKIELGLEDIRVYDDSASVGSTDEIGCEYMIEKVNVPEAAESHQD